MFGKEIHNFQMFYSFRIGGSNIPVHLLNKMRIKKDNFIFNILEINIDRKYNQQKAVL